MHCDAIKCCCSIPAWLATDEEPASSAMRPVTRAAAVLMPLPSPLPVRPTTMACTGVAHCSYPAATSAAVTAACGGQLIAAKLGTIPPPLQRQADELLVGKPHHCLGDKNGQTSLNGIQVTRLLTPSSGISAPTSQHSLDQAAANITVRPKIMCIIELFRKDGEQLKMRQRPSLRRNGVLIDRQ